LGLATMLRPNPVVSWLREGGNAGHRETDAACGRYGEEPGTGERLVGVAEAQLGGDLGTAVGDKLLRQRGFDIGLEAVGAVAAGAQIETERVRPPSLSGLALDSDSR
jgi:hypothetical protein